MTASLIAVKDVPPALPLSPREAMARLQAAVTPGTKLTVIQNTYRPRQNGGVRTILKVTDTRADVLGPDGIEAFITLPADAAQDLIRWHADDIVSWRMGRGGEEVRHRITYLVEVAR